MNLIIGLILIFFIAKYISKGLFDQEWHRNAQDRIDSIKNERVFWNIMSKKFEMMCPGIDDVAKYYFNYKAGAHGGDAFDKKVTDQDVLDKRIINRRNSPFKNINLLVAELENREKLINDLLLKNSFTFNRAEILKEFELWKEKRIYSSLDSKLGTRLLRAFVDGETNYNPYDSTTVGGVAKGDVTGNDIFTARKAFENISSGFKYDETGNNKIAPHEILELNMARIEMDEFITELLCKKTKNDSDKLKQALNNWEKLNMLRWCVVDFATPHLGLNGIQWAMLQLFEGVLL